MALRRESLCLDEVVVIVVSSFDNRDVEVVDLVLEEVVMLVMVVQLVLE